METPEQGGEAHSPPPPEMPDEPLRDPRVLGSLIMFWGAAYPVVLMIGVQFADWMLAPHYYDLPAVFLGHFLFFMGGFILTREKIGAGKWLTAIAAVIGIASSVLVLSLIHMIKPHGIAGTSLWLIQGFLYGLHVLYLAGNVFCAWVVFRIKA